jgi:hypothetical protein
MCPNGTEVALNTLGNLPEAIEEVERREMQLPIFLSLFVSQFVLPITVGIVIARYTFQYVK